MNREILKAKIAEAISSQNTSGNEKLDMILAAVDSYSSEAKVLPEESNYKQLRKEKGLTLREVEKLTGISNAYLSQLENGKIKKPSYDTIQKLNAVYNDR